MSKKIEETLENKIYSTDELKELSVDQLSVLHDFIGLYFNAISAVLFDKELKN